MTFCSALVRALPAEAVSSASAPGEASDPGRLAPCWDYLPIAEPDVQDMLDARYLLDQRIDLGDVQISPKGPPFQSGPGSLHLRRGQGGEQVSQALFDPGPDHFGLAVFGRDDLCPD